MDPIGNKPIPLQEQHTFQKLDPTKHEKWHTMLKTALIASLGQDLLKQLRHMQHVMKQGQQ